MDIIEFILKNVEIVIFLIIIIAQVIGSVFAKNRKQQQRQRQQQGTAKQQSPQHQQKPAPQSVRPARPKQPKQPAPGRTAGPAVVDCEWERFLVDSEIKNAAKNEARESDTYDYPTSKERENTLTTQAKTGIVWAEILQPPVSMR